MVPRRLMGKLLRLGNWHLPNLGKHIHQILQQYRHMRQTQIVLITATLGTYLLRKAIDCAIFLGMGNRHPYWENIMITAIGYSCWQESYAKNQPAHR